MKNETAKNDPVNEAGSHPTQAKGVFSREYSLGGPTEEEELEDGAFRLARFRYQNAQLKAQANRSKDTPAQERRLPDLQNLPEDPVIRPSLISNGVPRQFWPEGVITLKQAEVLILKYGEQSTTDD